MAEIIIYIAILVFILTVVINILFSIIKSQRSFNASKSIENSATLSMERISREIREAQLVSTASSTFNVHPGVLVLEGTDADGNTRIIEFRVATSTLIIKENGVSLGGLTKSDTRVTNLVFTLITSTSSRAIRTQMSLESGTSTYYRSGNFYLTTILRGSL